MTLYIRWFALATLVAGSLSESVLDQTGTEGSERNLLFAQAPVLVEGQDACDSGIYDTVSPNGHFCDHNCCSCGHCSSFTTFDCPTGYFKGATESCCFTCTSKPKCCWKPKPTPAPTPAPTPSPCAPCVAAGATVANPGCAQHDGHCHFGGSQAGCVANDDHW